MGSGPAPASKAYRTRLHQQLAALGFDARRRTELVAADLIRVFGTRPREAWRLAAGLSLDEAAARYNAISEDPNAPMRKARIWDFEQWPTRGVRPTLRTLRILARVYGTGWEQLVDTADLLAFSSNDLREYQALAAMPRPGGETLPAFRPEVNRTKWREHILTQEGVIMAAARDSGDFGSRAEATNVGPRTLEQFDADLRRIVLAYPHRPVFPTFIEVLELRDAAFELLDGRQRPDQTRDLYLIAGTLCAILANASFDLGHLAAATTQARTALTCAEHAGVNWLRAWLLGMQSLIAYWDDRYAEAASLASSGAGIVPESGSAAVRLASIEARAHARLGDEESAHAALQRATAARDAVSAEDEYGGMLDFPIEKQVFYSATCNVWLPGTGRLREAERSATEAIGLYERAEPHNRRTGELLLARLDLASARLGADDPHAAAEEIRTVLAAGALRRTDSLRRRLRQLNATITQARYGDTALARELGTEIVDFCASDPAPALPESGLR